jgi:hypothetical protein
VTVLAATGLFVLSLLLLPVRAVLARRRAVSDPDLEVLTGDPGRQVLT